MQQPLSIRDLLIAISRLPEDRPVNNPKKWYRTQKEHWIGWLFEYNGPGAYGRQTLEGRDAKFVYNHVVEPELLLYLAKASGVPSGRVASARKKLGAVGSVEIVGCKPMPDGGYAWLLAAPRRYRRPVVPRGVPQPGFWHPKFPSRSQ
jgi:hypothetical protein